MEIYDVANKIFEIYQNPISNIMIFQNYTLLFFSIVVFSGLIKFGGLNKAIFSHLFTNLLFLILAYYLNAYFGTNQDLASLLLFEIILFILWISIVLKHQ